MEDSNTLLDEETLLLPADDGEGMEPDEIAGLRAAVWQRDLDLMDARGEIAELRQSVAILTSMGAELAAALGTGGATRAAAATPAYLSEVGDFEASVAALQGDVDAATAQRLELETRLGERDAEVYRLEDQLAAAQAETEWMAAGKAELETTLQAQARGWDDVRARLAALRSELEPEGQEPVAGGAEPLVPTGEEPAVEEAPVAGPDAVFGEIARITAGIAGLRLALQQRDEALAAASALATASGAEPAAAATSGTEVEVPPGPSDTEAAGLQAELARVQTELDQTKEESAKAGEASAAEIAALTAAAAASAKTIEEKDAELEKAKADIAALEQQNEKLSAEVKGVQSDSDGGNLKKIVGLTAAAAGVTKLVRGDDDEEAKAGEPQAEQAAEPQTGSQVAEQTSPPDSQVADLEAELKRTKEESAKAEEAKAGEIAALTAAAAASAKTLRDKDAELEEAKSTIADMETQNAKLSAELQRLKAEPESGKLGAVVGLAAVTAGAAKVLGDDSGGEVDVTGEPQEGVSPDAELANLRAELDALRLSLAAVSSEKDAAQTQLQQQAEELAAAHAKLASAEPIEQPAEPAAIGEVAPSRVAAKTAPIQAALISGVRPQTTAIVQDLAALKGIGPVYEQRLYERGIGTFWEVANLSNDEFVDYLKPNRAAQKQLDFDAIRADALRLARETFSMGHLWDGAAVDDLQRIEGVGQIMEQRLYDAGIHTFEQLAGITLEQLSAIIGDSELFTPDLMDWITQARALAAQRSRP